MKGKASLETIANIVIVIAGIACAVGWTRYLLVQPPLAASPPPAYAVGDSLAGVSEVGQLRPARTLLLYVSSSCHFCSASMPFYRRLAAARQSARGETRLVVLSRDPDEVLTGYLQDNSLTPDDVVHVSETSNIKLRLTPTLVLLDQDRSVLRIWVGQLSSVAEEDVTSQFLDKTS